MYLKWKKNLYEKGDLDNNSYTFEMKLMLPLDIWHIFFLIIALGVNFPNIYSVYTVE